MRNKLDVSALYLGDNGRCFCGAHAGANAQATGRDLSGQRIERLTDADLRYAKESLGVVLACEQCEAMERSAA